MSKKEGSNKMPAEDGKMRRIFSTYLTKLAYGSAPFISTFLLVHLTAPAMANLGGSELSSRVMILGREYYQTSFGHTFLVATPIIIHTASGLAKRVVAPQYARKLSSLFALTGYSAVLFFLPIHYLVHRVYPADPAPPIYEFAPSELDFEYVKFGLQRWPWKSSLLYAGLTMCVAWHAAEGMQIIWNAWFRGKSRSTRATLKARGITFAAVVLPVLSGTLVIFREPLIAFTSSIARFEGAFSRNFVYRL